MIIPKKAIEKAIEGGWMLWGKYKFRSFQDPMVMFESPTGDWIQLATSQEIALDPLFWQALGKALGWSEEYLKTNPYYSFEWMREAHRFYDLILTGGDTETFWKDLDLR